MIYLSSDHGGFDLRTVIVSQLQKIGAKFMDLGPTVYNAEDDYPDYAAKVSEKVSANPEDDLGILICRSGQGMSIVANKFSQVRAAVVWNNEQAKMSRLDDMVNVLCLPSDYINQEIAQTIVKTWLDTNYSQEPRHIRRVQKISAIESKNFV